MKTITLLFLILCTLSCNKFSNSKKINFQPSEIIFAELKLKLSDSTSVFLSRSQIENIPKAINLNENPKLIKAGPKFWLVVKNKNDSILYYKITDRLFGENDLYVDLNEKDFFKNINKLNPKTKSETGILGN